MMSARPQRVGPDPAQRGGDLELAQAGEGGGGGAGVKPPAGFMYDEVDSELRTRSEEQRLSEEGERNAKIRRVLLGLSAAVAAVSLFTVVFSKVRGDPWFRSPGLFPSGGTAPDYYVEASPYDGMCVRDGPSGELVVPCGDNLASVRRAMERINNMTGRAARPAPIGTWKLCAPPPTA